jgi:hypothetical protein
MFTVNLTDRSPSATPSYAYAWAEQSTVASYMPSTFYQKNFVSCGLERPITMQRTATGRYTASIPSAFGTPSNVMVGAYSSSGASCKVASWRLGNDGTLVDVACFNATGVALDIPFVMVYSSDGRGC